MLFVGALIAHPTVNPQTVAGYWAQAETQAKALPPNVAMTPIPWPWNSPWSWPAGTPGGIAALTPPPATNPQAMPPASAAQPTPWTWPSGSPSTPAPTAPVEALADPGPVPSPNYGLDWYLTGDIAQLFSASSPMRTPIANMQHTTFAAGSAWNSEVRGSATSSGPFGPSRPLGYGIPLYVSSNPSDPVVTVGQCTMYGGCSMAGTRIHMNPGDYVQAMPDQHVLLVDPSMNVEVDCWKAMSAAGSQGAGASHMTAMAATTHTLTCGSGGAYALASSGLHGNFANASAGTGEGIHFGPAAGSYFVTPNELLNGYIPHALALNANCANAGGSDMYPADNTQQTDSACVQAGGPYYGEAFQLNWAPAQIAASSHSIECKAMLTAMATYGAYISDTGDDGSMVDIVSEYAYTSDPGEMGPDPYPQIRADMQAAGDADGGGNWTYCFNGLSASDFNLVELAPPAGS